MSVSNVANGELLDDGTNNASDIVTLPGIQKPVIRINKQKETCTANNQPTQPIQAQVKINCQTPNAIIKYTTKGSTPTRIDVVEDGTLGFSSDKKVGLKRTNGGAWVKEAPAFGLSYSGNETLNNYTNQFNIGPTENNARKGYKTLIIAQSQSSSSGAKETSFEAALRTVITFICSDNFSNGANRDSLNGNYRWIRGGDATEGGNTIESLPYTWNKNDYTKIRAMTFVGKNEYYWVSWALNTTSYVGFIAGNMPSDANELGPSRWYWATCGWVPQKYNYPIYPGEETYIPVNACDNYGGYQYQGKHLETRP